MRANNRIKQLIIVHCTFNVVPLRHLHRKYIIILVTHFCSQKSNAKFQKNHDVFMRNKYLKTNVTQYWAQMSQ